MSQMFDYLGVARKLDLDSRQLAELEALVRAQYAPDEMMFELRMLRTLMAIEEGALTLSEAINEFRSDSRATTPESRLGSTTSR